MSNFDSILVEAQIELEFSSWEPSPDASPVWDVLPRIHELAAETLLACNFIATFSLFKNYDILFLYREHTLPDVQFS
jgi:hypothetical protein